MKKEKDDTKSALITSFENIDNLLAKHIGELLSLGGTLGVLLITIATISGAYVLFFPDLNGIIYKLDLFRHVNYDLRGILLFISVSSISLLFLVYFLNLILAFVKPLINSLCSLFIKIVNSLISFLSRVFFFINMKKISASVERLKFIFVKEIFIREYWLAKSTGTPMKLDLPIQGTRAFSELSFDYIVIEKTDNHWRAGVTFLDANGYAEYIFHVHEDVEASGNLQSRIVLRVPGKEIRDIKNISVKQENIDTGNFLVRRSREMVDFFIDTNLVGSFEVPLENIEKISISAWADGREFEIAFKNIELIS